ncbi:hypothetical protein LARI1_G008054 [Lachnellula arida]|uniref:Heterokaryon incompatibility domain-containing protein n=1 Tax=Lachnellula arida TaxID=1316785 RepID=A0A8T9B5B0_9HELO|nr:hypothetical protein LARI1_G008054 [Lachnellula arida]
MKFQEVNALLPTRILDIGGQNQDRISLREFPTGSHGQYAALSHCWGTKQTFITSSTNLEDRKKSIDFNELPQTFRDAVSVSRSLGINYLWIDSLCIIQNDIDDWKRESIKMEQVYSDATLVISASRATSDSTGFLNPRRTDEIISISYSKGEKMSTLYLQQALQPFDSTDPLKSEPLNQRGWALQERYLPRRTLYFGSHQTFWNCQTLSRSEDGRILQRPWFDFQELILPANENPGTTWASSEQLMLYQPWYNMIDIYMGCGLTYESDRLPAIAGLAKSLWLKSQDSYLAGLWRGGLLAGLLWRRYKLGALHRLAAFRAPSWSWASVDGEIEFRVYAWFNKFPYGIKYFASLQDVQIDVDNGPFGTVSGGWLSIDAPIFPIVGSRGPFSVSNFSELLYGVPGKVTISSWCAYHGVFDWLLLVKVPENDVLIAGSFDFPEDHEYTTTGSLFAVFLAGVCHPPHFRHASSNEGLFGLIVKKHEDENVFSRVGMLHGKFMAEDRSHSDEEMFTQYRSWRRQDYLSSTSKIESQTSWCDISLHEKERRVSILR